LKCPLGDRTRIPDSISASGRTRPDDAVALRSTKKRVIPYVPSSRWTTIRE
jgi:hypothetical protein